MPLALVLTDFYRRPEELGRSQDGELALHPSLARFDCKPLSGDWLHWLADHIESAPSASDSVSQDEPYALALALARLGARGTAAADAVRAAWLMSAVHTVAGLDHVRLHARGCLRLDPEEGQQLAARFATDFAGSGWSLQALPDGRALLTSDQAQAKCRTERPERWLGRNIADARPEGAGAQRLRALLAELEMWLFDSALNRRRQHAGQPTVTQLWPWDVWRKSPWQAASAQGRWRLWGQDAAAAWLAGVGALGLCAPPHSFADWLRREPGGDDIVLLDSLTPTTEGDGSIEEHWLKPALCALQDHRLDSLCVIANDRLYRSARRRRWWPWS